MKNSFKFISLLLIVLVLVGFVSCSGTIKEGEKKEESGSGSNDEVQKLPLYEIRNDNTPYFTEADYSEAAEKGYFIYLSPLDEYGRAGMCKGLFDYSHMPDYPREPLNTKPTGWIQGKYDSSIVPGGWLYARAHILAFQTSGIQDNPQNLITGTRALNNDGMLLFENMTADHMREERTHRVLYRVTPDFKESELLARGILLESDCLDCDDTADYCAYVRNIQDGIVIDYATGANHLSSNPPEVNEDQITLEDATFILNTGSLKIHMITCSSAPEATSTRYKLTRASYEELTELGFTACGVCRPDINSVY